MLSSVMLGCIICSFLGCFNRGNIRSRAKTQINQNVCNFIDVPTLQRSFENMKRRVTLCLKAEGRHFEHFVKNTIGCMTLSFCTMFELVIKIIFSLETIFGSLMSLINLILTKIRSY
jgi:hypothetical protein